MADQKISLLPPDSSLDGNHYVPLVDPTGPTTKRTFLSVLADWLFNQTNLPSGATGSPVTRAAENVTNYVASGLVWSGDSYGSTRNASMTAGVVYINGRRISISAVVARSFTASKDTYVDVLDNADGTGTLVYTEVANNAASPALAANSIRIAIIITGAANIANVGSVNQGQTDKVLPIASSVAYSVTDSLGNLIYNRSPSPTLIGYREYASNISTGAANGQFYYPVGLASVPAIIPAGRRAKITIYFPSVQASTGGPPLLVIGAIESGEVGGSTSHQLTANWQNYFHVPVHTSPSAGLHTYKPGIYCNQNPVTVTINANANSKMFMAIELE